MKQESLDRLLLQLQMHPDALDLERCRAGFLEDLQAGLRGTPQGMLMLPTYLTTEGTIPRGQKIIVLDAGGTNFRRAVAHFSDSGALILEQFQKMPMPGTQGEITAEEFFDQIAEAILPVIDESDRIGFCFSYAVQMQENLDGRLKAFCKEVQVQGAQGLRVCEQLQLALQRKGVQAKKHWVLLNDAAATLLGGRAAAKQPYDAYLGCVYGTGLNCCYPEKPQNIVGIADTAGRNMIINMESGMHHAFAQGAADRILDETSELPGDHRFEKMVSGAYLGRLTAITAKLCQQRGALSAHCMVPEAFSLAALGGLLDGGAMPGFAEEDAAALRLIAQRLQERAEKLVFLSLACVLEHIGNPARSCITMEGTTFQKSRIFRERFFADAAALQKQRGIQITIAELSNTTLTGTAMAGLLN